MEQNNSCIPLLSIVIATRNRYPYAVSAIQSILAISDPRLELVIQDNSDSRELEAYVQASIRDSRFRYRYNSSPFSMTDNFNAAVDLATGEYLCLIGDDDGVNPEIIEAAEWAKAQEIDSIRTDLIASYYWPDVRVYTSLQKRAGKLFVNGFSGQIVFPDIQEETRKCVRNGGQGYLGMGLPKIYHGIVKKRCLDQVNDLTGAYLKGLSPDIFGAMAVANFARRVASIDYPLTIGGTSVLSNACDSSAGRHKGRIEDAPHLRNRPNYAWPDIIPRFYSVETIWAESAIVALKETNRLDLLQKFGLPTLYALCIVANPDYANVILRDMYRAFDIAGRNRFVGTFQFCYYVIVSQCLRGIKYGMRRLRSAFSETISQIAELNNIQEATDALVHYLAAHGWRLRDCISL